jgi:superfamily II DNA helicase RecQ
MALRFFVIPIVDSSEPEKELNAFLDSHRVVSVERRFVEQGSQSLWAVCVDFNSGPSGKANSYSSKERIDYREKLTPEQFRVFAQLRELRKELAQKDGVPVYQIFNNDQLARMVVDRATTKAALEKIEGVGEAKLAKYGSRFLDLLNKSMESQDETSGPAV